LLASLQERYALLRAESTAPLYEVNDVHCFYSSYCTASCRETGIGQVTCLDQNLVFITDQGQRRVVVDSTKGTYNTWRAACNTKPPKKKKRKAKRTASALDSTLQHSLIRTDIYLVFSFQSQTIVLSHHPKHHAKYIDYKYICPCIPKSSTSAKQDRITLHIHTHTHLPHY
jgi:hypothetical protein